MLGCEFCIYRFPCLLNIVGRTKLSFLLTPGIIRSRFKNLVSPRFIEKIPIPDLYFFCPGVTLLTRATLLGLWLRVDFGFSGAGGVSVTAGLAARVRRVGFAGVSVLLAVSVFADRVQRARLTGSCDAAGVSAALVVLPFAPLTAGATGAAASVSGGC